MWPHEFESRLRDWNDLRARCQSMTDISKIAGAVNDWWFRVPTVNHYLHWHYHQDWPNAWELLHEDLYCDLARGLGMLYTISMLESPIDLDVELIDCNKGNLVLVDGGKYILNWAPGELLNIQSQQITVRTRIGKKELQHLMG